MCAMAVAHASPTLYEKIGGAAKCKAIAEEFTAAILADDRINFTFAESDVKKFTQLFYEQLCNVTGGPCKYTGRDMHEAHAKLAINEAQFNAIAEDLYIGFEKAHVPYRLQNKVMVILAPMETGHRQTARFRRAGYHQATAVKVPGLRGWRRVRRASQLIRLAGRGVVGVGLDFWRG